ncbi:MAG: sulfite exporter TauE/SafE family protein [Alphaproteobacteria bacterium]|jgi:hypothetical protein|nr:sulfite exporter TauE/SafE family protein [Alphaproteobacteria bacterium]MDP6518155.1 sulfite exporter TauE/SafE family protein [Alphaproteobacteria bacterium]
MSPADVVANPWFYMIAVPALLMVGIFKAGFGTGAGVFAVAMTALVVPPFQAAAILLPVLCMMDAIGVWAYRRSWDGANLAIMLPGAMVGVAVGTLTVDVLQSRHIALMIGVIAVAFSLRHLIGPAAPEAAPRRRWLGTFWAGVAGFTSFLAHAGGPPANIYLLPQRLDKSVFVGTTVVFFAVVNYVKLAPYAWLGQFSAENLATALILAPIAPLAMWLGVGLHRRIDAALFYKTCYRLLVVVGLKLIGDGLGLWG